MNLVDTASEMGAPIVQELMISGMDLEQAYIPGNQATLEKPENRMQTLLLGMNKKNIVLDSGMRITVIIMHEYGVNLHHHHNFTVKIM